jgi:hypothetical protein
MKHIKECLSGFRFKELFTEHLMWDSSKGSYAIEAGDSVCEVEAVAEKKGLVVLICRPTEGTPFPGSAERKRIEREVTKLHHEHLIVFVDKEQTRQVWQVPKRDGGKTIGHSEVPFFKGKGVEHLARRIEAISFTLDESEKVSLIEVSARVNQALLAEKVTKKFFKEFGDQRKAFLKFLDWIEDESKRDWYCSVLLNRLMFIYFIAEKGFLPEGKKFLSRRLESNMKTNGADTFYTHFLLPLSFFGFGEPQGKRGRFEDEFEGVLYLNGGLFAVHSLERELGISKEAVESVTFPAGAMIPDAEFKKWFGYFDDWRWTLDEEKVENEGDISPHILGYIFEKYINQKQMGAYYTKEDITGYICRNTIIPRLFDMLAETSDKGKQAVDPLPIGPHPNLLNDGRGISRGEGIDRYIYPSVKQEAKLPTETDFEQEQRRTQNDTILREFDSGSFKKVDDFITANLDIEKLALDFVENIQDPDVLHQLYFRGLQRITVLDPTCGSGAFLFAGLGVLYPLYNAALSRMRYLVGKSTGVEPDVVNWAGRLNFDDLENGQGVLVDNFGNESRSIQEMKEEVERINHHPSAEYFIKKSIIVNNLFGVDIMEEAVEICKLRLFLSLIATVERDESKPNQGVEPLPDIDFNILPGNTLVGYSSIPDINRLWHKVELGTSTLAFDKDHSELEINLLTYGDHLTRWRRYQLGESTDFSVKKDVILDFAKSVKDSLNDDIWRLYNTAKLALDHSDPKKPRILGLEEFTSRHEPFHWLLEFPFIEASGGFDVIVGNPPYVEIAKVKDDYRILGFKTEGCGNLYAPVIERTVALLRNTGRSGMIIPHSAFCTDRMSEVQSILKSTSELLWISTYCIRPAKLFVGVDQRLAIYLSKEGQGSTVHSTRYQKWNEEFRPHLLSSILYCDVSRLVAHNSVPKLASTLELSLWEKIVKFPTMGLGLSGGTVPVYFHNAPRYWIRAMTFVPYFWNERYGEKVSSHLKQVTAKDAKDAKVIASCLNSSLFFWWFTALSNCRDLISREIESFPIDLAGMSSIHKDRLTTLCDDLMADLKRNAYRKTCFYKATGQVIYDEYYPRLSKSIIDEIDTVLADHFGLSSDELEFIINFDIKFRVGSDEEDS